MLRRVHLRQIVRRTCMTPSVRSSHSPPLPLTIPPIPPELPTMSWPSSMRSDFEHTTTMGTPDALWVSVPGPRGRRVALVREVAPAKGGSAIAEGSA